MNAIARLCLLLVLSLALPVNGMAHLLMAADHCPMQAQGSSPSAAMAHGDMHHASEMSPASLDQSATADSDLSGDRCGQPAKSHAQATEKACKSGLDCKTASLLQVSSTRTPDLAIDRPGPFPLYFAPLPGQPEPLWHPPRV